MDWWRKRWIERYYIWINNGNEYIKEYYYNDKLEFEGKYLNGKKHWEGKEYNKDNKLIFEGEYLNGKRWNGKRKEYYDNGILKFEGEYLNWKRQGKGQ